MKDLSFFPCISKGLVAVLALGLFSAESKASVIVEFQQVGNNVVATTSGSLTKPMTPPLTIADGNGDISGSFRTLYYLPGTVSLYSGGQAFDMGSMSTPTSASGDPFGFGSTLYLPYSLPAGSSYSPVTTFVWEGKTLEQLDLTNTPKVAFQLGDQTITYVTVAIPEPGSAFLCMAGLAGLLYVMRRKLKTVRA